MIGGDAEQAKGEAQAGPLGLYVHVPFCASTCDFCAFYQTVPTAGAVRRFLDTVRRELELVSLRRPVTTVFWGGGTPGLLAASDLETLATVVRAHCGGQPVEWTVELAPGSVTEARLHALRAAGVTRISMGVQSFQPPLLEALGRNHSLAQIHRAYERIRSVGFPSVNLDLMFALPGQTEAEWLADLAAATALRPDHVSTYCLTFEEDTKLWVKLSQGRVKLDPEHEAALYQTTWGRLAELGYAQYEVSNFARPGHACVHNVNTWRMHEWVGIGPSAATQCDRIRGANVADLEQWIAHVEAGRRVTEDRITLTPEQLAEDALIFGLRMNEGVDVGQWRRRAPGAPWDNVARAFDTMEAEGLATRRDEVVRLTDRGRLVADAIGGEIMSAFEPTNAAA